MTIERINDNKAKITLSLEELSYRKITLSEIQKDKNKAQDFFMKLIEDSHLNDTFLEENSTLFIEASTSKNSFIVIITKVTIADNYNINSLNYSYKISSNIFEFGTIKNLISAINILSKKHINDVSLYFYNQKYYLIFSSSITRTSEFTKIFLVLSEYCDNFYKSKFSNILYEYGNCIFYKNALANLSCYTLE